MKIIYENNCPSQFNTVFDELISLLVEKSKSFEHKIIFNSRGWKVCPNAANSKRWQNYSYFLAQKSPAPPCQLPVGYVPLLFVLWTFICVSILLFILMPCCLKNPPIQANGTKPWVLRNTLWGLVESSLFLATTQSISEQHTHSTTLFSRWQFSQVHLRGRFEVRF